MLTQILKHFEHQIKEKEAESAKKSQQDFSYEEAQPLSASGTHTQAGGSGLD